MTVPDIAPPPSWVPARALSAAVERDPQFRLPRRPRAVDGLVAVPLPDGLLLEGTAERQVLRGRAATTLVPRLLDHLDGTLDLDGLASVLDDVDPRAVRSAVALLYACGVLEDGHVAAPGAGVSAAVRAYCSRHVDTTRVNASAEEVLARLAEARVAILGTAEPLGSRLAAALKASGVHDVTVELPATGEPPTLVAVLADAAEDAQAMERIDEWCARHGIPWMRFALVGAEVEVGPYFDRSHTACYRCFHASRGPHAPSARAVPGAELACVGLVGLELVHLLGRICRTASVRGVTTYALDHFAARSAPLLRRPACRTCCPTTHGDPAPHPAHSYEQAVAFPPRHLIDPKDHQHHYRAANLALQRESKRYPGARYSELVPAPRTPRPVGRLLGDGGPGALDAGTLAGLLLRVAGIREDGERSGGKVQRWAPTGGNLGSVQAYVTAPILPAGWHYYDAHRHALAAVGPLRSADGPGELAHAASAGELPEEPEALLVLTGALTRVGRKYGDFAYRIVCLDGGVAVAHAVALAWGYGLEARAASRWDDELLLSELGLGGDAEPITSLIGLYRRTA